MGTKRIGRVGERDAGFHSNGALPSALSCCHYGSEVFRSCRKQSYGKPARRDSSLVFCFSSLPSSTSSAHPADVMWSQSHRGALFWPPSLHPSVVSLLLLLHFICLHCTMFVSFSVSFGDRIIPFITAQKKYEFMLLNLNFQNVCWHSDTPGRKEQSGQSK